MLLLLTSTAWACSCRLPTVEEAMQQSDVVFRGTVVAVTPPETHPLLEPYETTIVVREVWKGALRERVTLLGGSALCTVQSLPEDTEWIVFAQGDADGITLSVCSGSEQVGQPVGAALTDLLGSPPPIPVSAQLGPGYPPQPQ